MDDDALVELGRALREADYHFVTPTPETHRRVNARAGNEEARDLRGVFGWSRPFREGLLPRELQDLLARAGALATVGGGAESRAPESGGAESRAPDSGEGGRARAGGGPLLRSRVRFSTLAGELFVHSAYPTVAADSVFFGPDTYRFAALLLGAVQRAGTVVDVGCGSGAGGILLARRAGHVVLSDVNPLALRYARVNARLSGAGDRVEVVESDVLRSVRGDFDLVVSNPPYLADEGARVYRDGGGPRGIDLSVRIAREALERLPRGGRLLLYSASPVEDGRNPLHEALLPLLRGTRSTFTELDPDVFGEELERPAYAQADRIAVVALDAVLL